MMKKAILISVALHIAALYTYPALNLRARQPHAEEVNISYLGVLPDEDFPEAQKSKMSGKNISSTSPFPGLENESVVWDAPGVSVDVQYELFAEPMIEKGEMDSLLKNGGYKSLLDGILETFEKETPPLIEELETEDEK
jgi:hypothetical protein